MIQGKEKIISVKLKPKAKRNQVIETKPGEFLISVTAPAVDNQANLALIKLLADYYHLAPSLLKIKSGQTSRHKLISLPWS